MPTSCFPGQLLVSRKPHVTTHVLNVVITSVVARPLEIPGGVGPFPT
jgi:hypothetical protein